MESPLELTVTPELHKHNLVEQEAHQVERLGRGGRLVSHVSHCETASEVDVAWELPECLGMK